MSLRSLIFLLSWAVPGIVFAQSSRLDQADRLYESLAFNEAISAYESALEKVEDAHAMARLGDCYRLTHRYQEAQQWYARVADRQDVDPIYKLYYGMMLQSNGRCEEAVSWFKAYALKVPNDPRGAELAAACEQFAILSEEGSLYEIEKLDFNSQYADIAPALYQQGIVFSSARAAGGLKRKSNYNGEPFLDLYYIEVDDSVTVGEATDFAPELHTPYHDGPAAFDADDEVLYLTRNINAEGKAETGSDGVMRVRILEVRQRAGKWRDFKEFKHNSKDYNTAHPTLSPDGKAIIFSSDMPGGEGGSDLWICRREGGDWGKPVNAGPLVNTPGNEAFPILHPEGSLYFASDGLGGMGGLDLYAIDQEAVQAFIDTAENGIRAEPIRMGFPINSSFDDFGLIFDEEGRNGYFSSNREGGQGSDDIYKLRKASRMISGRVQDMRNGDPIALALVRLDMPGKRFKIVETDSSGRFEGEIPLNTEMLLRASAEHFLTDSFEIGAEASDGIVDLVINLKPETYLTGRLVDEVNGIDLVGVKVALRNLQNDRVDTVVLDREGFFQFGDLDALDHYRLEATKGDLQLVSEDLTDLKLGENRMADIHVFRDIICNLPTVYFDFDKSSIRKDAMPRLQEILDFLLQNDRVNLVLASHCDSRGTEAYNDALSARRTASVAQFLMEHGVQPGQLTLKHYGETQLVNDCGDGVPCPEEAHQLNRRTDFSCAQPTP